MRHFIDILHKKHFLFFDDENANAGSGGGAAPSKDENDGKTLSELIDAEFKRLGGKEDEKPSEGESKGKDDNSSSDTSGKDGKEGKKKDDDSEGDDEEDEDKLSPEDLKNAKLIFKALKDPEMGKTLVLGMAKKYGLDSDSTKQEKKEVKASILDKLSKALGGEYPELTKLLAPTLDEVISELVNKSTAADDTIKELQGRLKKLEDNEVGKTVQTAMDDAFGAYTNCDEKVQGRVSKLMDEMPPSPKISPKKYFEILTDRAFKELGITPQLKGSSNKDVSEATKQKRSNNAKDISSRLSTERGNEPGSRQESKNEKMDLNTAVNKAMEEEAAKLGKK